MCEKQLEEAIIAYDRFMHRASKNGVREVLVEDVPDNDVRRRVRLSCDGQDAQVIDGLSTAMICLRQSQGFQAVKATFFRDAS